MQQARLRAIAHFSHTHEHVFQHHLTMPIHLIILLKIPHAVSDCMQVSVSISRRSSMHLMRHAGTAVQHTGRAKSRDVFRRHILPVLEQQPSLWPGADYAAFEHAAGMVQSRSFRLNEENFLTGESVEGASCLAPNVIINLTSIICPAPDHWVVFGIISMFRHQQGCPWTSTIAHRAFLIRAVPVDAQGRSCI